MRGVLLVVALGSAMAEKCLIEENIDYFGFDIEGRRGFEVGSQEECVQACCGSDLCQYWLYIPEEGRCWLKTSKTDRREISGHISGNKACASCEARGRGCGGAAEEGVAYRGQSYARIPDIPTRYECRARCDADAECRSWSWNGNIQRCYLKGCNPGRRSEESGWWSRMKSCATSGPCPLQTLEKAPRDPYECTGSEPIEVLMEGPHQTIEIHSKNFPEFAMEDDTSGRSRCQWKVSALHGAQVQVTALEVETAGDCMSTSALSLEDQSDDSSYPLHYPGKEARCNLESTIPSSCLTSEGELTITATPGVRFRLLLKAILPVQCPARETQDYCPQGPCCGEEECSCEYLVGTEPLELKSTKAGTCTYDLVSTAGSQVAVNFLEMKMPPQASSKACEAWVSLEETDRHLSSVIGNQKFCGLTVPNYPGPSVIMSGANKLTVNYFLPETSLELDHGFKIAAAAVNPLCAPQSYEHIAGEDVCTATCGSAHQPEFPERDMCPEPSDPCVPAPQKRLIMTVYQNGTDIFVPNAEVNITSSSSFFTHRSTVSGEVTSQGFKANTSLEISVAAEGYLPQVQALQLSCENVDCQDCEVRVTLEMDPVKTTTPWTTPSTVSTTIFTTPEDYTGTTPTNPPTVTYTTPPVEVCKESMTLTINAKDEDKTPVGGVSVSVNYVNTEDDMTEELNIADGLLTDENGSVEVPVKENGDYKVALSKEGWGDEDIDVKIEDCLHKDEDVELKKDSPPCNATLDVHVKNSLDTGVEGAQVAVFRTERNKELPFSPLTADATGGVKQQMKPGKVHLKVSAEGFFTKEIEVDVTCDHEVIVIELKGVPSTTTPTPPTTGTTTIFTTPENYTGTTPTNPPTTTYSPPESCYDQGKEPITMNVEVSDLLTGLGIQGASVDVDLEESSGTKVSLVEKAVIASAWNTTILKNGLYHVSVKAAGYKRVTKAMEVNCQVPDCESCFADIELRLKLKQQQECEEEESEALACTGTREYDVFFKGGETVGNVYGLKKPEDCNKACKDNPECRSWSYSNNENYAARQERCILKGCNQGTKEEKAGWISRQICTKVETCPTKPKTCCDEDNILRVEVLDSGTKAVVPGAEVTVELETAEGLEAVSPYGECPAFTALEGSTQCGFPGITADQCEAKSCCWQPQQPMAASQLMRRLLPAPPQSRALTCGGPVEKDIAITGALIRQIDDIDDQAKCQERCDNNDQCRSWSWNGNNKVCYIKKCVEGGGDPKKVKKEGWFAKMKSCSTIAACPAETAAITPTYPSTTAVPTTVAPKTAVCGGVIEKGVAISGALIRQIDNIVDKQTCQERCDNNLQCRSWSWNGNNKVCYIKKCPENASGEFQRVKKDGWFARMKSCETFVACPTEEAETTDNSKGCGNEREYGIAYHGGNIERIYDLKLPKQCKDACNANPECRSWTYNNNTNTRNLCSLKGCNPGNRKELPGWISRQKSCDRTASCPARKKTCGGDVEEGIALYGKTIKRVKNTGLRSECQRLCDESPECRSWSWNGRREVCHLKGCEPGKRIKKTGWFSRMKSCETIVACTTSCYRKIGNSAMTTDTAGLVSMTLPGQGKYKVTVKRPGFEPLEYSWSPSRSTDESGCEMKTVTVSIKPEPVCLDEGIPLKLQVVDAEDGLPLPDTAIHLLITSSALGASQVDVGGSLSTDIDGGTSPIIYTAGTYRVSASLPGYIDLSEEITVPDGCCDTLNLTLPLIRVPEPWCPEDTDTALDLSVTEENTGNSVSGVLIDIMYMENGTTPVAQGVRTDDKGEVRVAVSKLGMYVARLNNASTIYEEGSFEPADAKVNLTCCTCPAVMEMKVSEHIMCEPQMNLTIMDNTTGYFIPGARVELLLTSSLSGPSLEKVGGIVTTDMSGTVLLHPSISGNYSIKVEAENYISREVPYTLACDSMDCGTCRIDLEVDMTEEFCSDRTMTMFVRESTNNTALEGALVTIVQETHHGPNDVGSFTVDSQGEVVLPLIGNGHYTTTISNPGYMNVTTTLKVAVTPDQCNLLAPLRMVPMAPPPEPGCVKVSLTWADEPKDLDLFSYRVHQYQPEDQCLTFFCDEKKQCDGVRHIRDNKDGGNAGAETITYCDVEDYSHMVWVDDRSDLGASLLTSEARLLITSDKGDTQEVVLRPSEGQEATSRYWLAGCLTTTADSFDFLPLNQFTNGAPNLEQPMHCHSRVELGANPVVPRAEVHVSVESTSGDPLSDVLVSLETSHETYSQVTEDDGKLVLPVTEDGVYSLLAQLDNYVPERLNFSLYCDGVEGQCATNVQVTMMSHEEDGALRIKLTWARDAARDLDLHLVQVVENQAQMVCTTYWNNMAGCADTELDQNVGAGAILGRAAISSSLAETVTIYDLAAKSNFRFMVFVDDNTATGADLGKVEPQLTMTQGNTIISAQMPQLPAWQDGSRFWLAGAIEVVGTSFRFVTANTWSMETPNNKAGITINNLLTSTSDEATPTFCEGSKLSVKVKNALTNEAVEGVTATILRLENGEEQVIANGAFPDANGDLSVSLLAAGHYEVQVKGAGYMPTRKSIGVQCSPADCNLCAPSVLVPLSPTLSKDQLRLTLGGGPYLESLDLVAVYRDTSIACATTPTQPNPENCAGVDGVTGTDGQGVETITFNQPTGEAQHVYTIYVEWTAPVGDTDAAFSASNTWVSLTDGTITEEIHMEPKNYGGERRWLAGCLLTGGKSDHGFQLRPFKTFFSEKPDEEVPDLCLETFGLAKKGPKWNGQCVKDKRARELPVDFGKSRDNDPEYCIKKCKSHEYAYAGVQYSKECFCGNTPPPEDAIIDDKKCNRKCPGDSSKMCGASWKMNVYETGYESGLTMIPGRSCDCSYSLGGCKISSPPPAGYACHCKYEGYWACGASLKKCEGKEQCPGNCKSKDCCKAGGGDCGGYSYYGWGK